MSRLLEFLSMLVQLTPIFLPLLWMAGATLFFFRKERRATLAERHKKTPVSILIPCHNEEETAESTIRSLDALLQEEVEIIAINDGSRDRTQDVLERLARTRPNMRVTQLLKNRGKAAALSLGLMACRHELVLCIDADSELDPEAPAWMASHFDNPEVGAVTGNPRVKNRGTLIGRLQVGEFSSLVGMIKRYHQCLGRLFALSGVLVMFRKSAVLDVGLWDAETVTEDIGISWKLQSAGWKLIYEPHALCDVLMPDTVKGLWRQRFRWAQGGFEVFCKHAWPVMKGPDFGLKLILLEYAFSVTWVFALPLCTMLFLSGFLAWDGPWALPVFLAGFLSMLQFTVGSALQSRYETARGLGYWAIWYPFVYWMLNSFVLFFAVPKVLFGRRQRFSTWISPDRGGVTYAKNN